MSNASKPCTEQGHAVPGNNSTQLGAMSFGGLPKLERGARIKTPQGTLIVKLENEVLFIF